MLVEDKQRFWVNLELFIKYNERDALNMAKINILIRL